MMDDSNVISTLDNGAGCVNGVHEEFLESKEQMLKEKNNAVSSCSSRNDGLTTSTGVIEGVDSSALEVKAVLPAKGQNDSTHDSKELGVIEQAGQQDYKLHEVEAKNQKPSSLKNATTTVLKKGKDAKVGLGSAASNGSLLSQSSSKEPSGSGQKSKSSNDKHTSDVKVNHHKPILSAAKVNCSKQPGQLQPISPSATVPHNETFVEKTKLRLVKKSESSEKEGKELSSPTNSEERIRNMGALPAYSFSFKCDERAEKRKEFFSKLEEKIQAKEAEQNNLQAKSKETQEAEIKMLRRSLMFKATPMPSFYQEPAPPKTELKKIPPTRAKSPKLGRKKSLPTRASEEESDVRTRPSRLSLDENLSQSNLAKGSPINNVKKPTRQSLPKLPSEKAKSPNETKKPSARKTSLSKETGQSTSLQNKSSEDLSGAAADVQETENEPSADPSHTELVTNIEPVAECQPATILKNEPTLVEH